MSVASGTIDPSIVITDELGDTLCSDYDYNSTAEIAGCTMPATGTCTLRVGDYDLVRTGTYGLYA